MATNASDLVTRAHRHVGFLASVYPDRRPGSPGNLDATSYVAEELLGYGWDVGSQEFSCVDWESDGGHIRIGRHGLDIVPSPYGTGIVADAPIRIVRGLDDLAGPDLRGSILVVAGDLATEPLTPRSYPFYSVEHHGRILDGFESASPAAIVAITGKYAATCGALEPFPLIEDGSFPIAAASIRPEDAAPLLDAEGEPAHIEIRSRRRDATAYNVMARRGRDAHGVLVVAHVDSKPNTPGALDNASGVAVLLLVAELLGPSRIGELPVDVELLAVNGEDHYAAPGEVAWLSHESEGLDRITLAVNIDGAGFVGGRCGYSTYNCDIELDHRIDDALGSRSSLARGGQWFQSDHAIFAMNGRPALAVTSEPIEQIMAAVYHSPVDSPDQVDPRQLVEIATAVHDLITGWPDIGSGP